MVHSSGTAKITPARPTYLDPAGGTGSGSGRSSTRHVTTPAAATTRTAATTITSRRRATPDNVVDCENLVQAIHPDREQTVSGS